jgi:glycosyl transferase family 87
VVAGPAQSPPRDTRGRLASTWGVRLLLEPRFQIVALSLLAIIVLGYRAFQFALLTRAPQFGYDLSAYWLAGSHLLQGMPIYTHEQLAGPYAPQGQYLYLYPPFLAVVFMPLAALFPDSYEPVAWLWAGLGAALLVGVVLWVAVSERLVARSNRLLAGHRGRLLLLAAAFAFPPIVGELVLGNVHLELLALFALAWWGVRRADERGLAVAGLAIGAASLVKILPLLVVVWFLATGRWRAALWAVVGAVALIALTLPITGIAPWLEYPTVLANMGRPADATDALAPAVWLGELIGPLPARVLVLLTAVAGTLWSARRQVEAASFGVAIAAATLVAPAVFHHYLAMLALPMLLALAASTPTGWVALAYLGMWGGQQPALGGLSWIVNRLMPAIGALLVPVGLLIWGHRRASALATSADRVLPADRPAS